MSGVRRRQRLGVDAMRHNNTRHRDASCDRQDGAGLVTVVLDRGILGRSAATAVYWSERRE
eukprot:3610112-Prymnesium_polylepis.1